MDELLKRIAALESQLGLRSEGVSLAPPPMIDPQQVALALAPIQPLLDDTSINDILINGPEEIFIERLGKLERTNLRFIGADALLYAAHAIAAQAGRVLDPNRPLLDARLPDGSRVNIVSPPLAVDGTTISIRKFAKISVTLDQMAQQGNLSPQLAELFKAVGRSRLNIVFSGGTGSGKTTMLNAVSEFIGDEERIVTIEDAAELRLQKQHVVRLETRPMRSGHPDAEVTMRDLTKNALRMRPDRILLGEVRGAEAFDMMQAMNTGHEGSLTTIHANHPRDAIARLENMIAMTSLNLTPQAIRAQIASAIHLIVQVSRMRDGKRRITFVSEVVGMENDTITMQDLFVFQNKGEAADGSIQGEFKWSGIIPRFVRRAAYYGEGDRLSAALGIPLPKF